MTISHEKGRPEAASVKLENCHLPDGVMKLFVEFILTAPSDC
ncbi:hypothetical protein [Laribacter hongkongensis]|nr:hypothetical protein [Laribacter hongkongensis]